jgi:Flp pilus assembly protein TadG
MHLRRIWPDCQGVVLPYFAIMLGVIIGLAALALDGGRMMTVQSQMQSAADALALAGAAELDRRPDSIARAQAAIRDLVTNAVAGAGAGQNAEVSSVQFLQSLPADDDLPITERNLTDDPTLAAYVQVTVQPITMRTILPVSLFSGGSTVAIGAQSVAGYDQVICDMPPVLVCNPFENSGMSYYQATQALVEADGNPAAHRQLLRLARSQFKNGGIRAGDMAYVEPATGILPAAACGPAIGRGIPQAIASTTVHACFRLSGVNLVPNDDQPAMDGLNTRFDIYAGGFNACRIYLPDLNVRKGFIAPGNTNWCRATPANLNWPAAGIEATALPPDQNMLQSNQSLATNVSVGNGIWNCAAYWATAHFSGPGQNLPPPGCTATATISRYAVYRYELDYLNDRSRGVEYGGPMCAPPGLVNRRVITAAIVNCGSSPVPVLNNGERVPVAGFGRFFLVWPAEQGTNGNPYAEFLGLVKRTDPISTDSVQLYR